MVFSDHLYLTEPSQPFWGDMVAAAGAGPKPIAYKSLTVDALVEAIRYCLKPEALTAANQIAEKMRAESGVEAAVASFHANLPAHRLSCDVVPDQPAAWVYKKGRTQIRLSKVAAEILSSHLMVDFKRLQT